MYTVLIAVSTFFSQIFISTEVVLTVTATVSLSVSTQGQSHDPFHLWRHKNIFRPLQSLCLCLSRVFVSSECLCHYPSGIKCQDLPFSCAHKYKIIERGIIENQAVSGEKEGAPPRATPSGACVLTQNKHWLSCAQESLFSPFWPPKNLAGSCSDVYYMDIHTVSGCFILLTPLLSPTALSSLESSPAGSGFF